MRTLIWGQKSINLQKTSRKFQETYFLPITHKIAKTFDFVPNLLQPALINWIGALGALADEGIQTHFKHGTGKRSKTGWTLNGFSCDLAYY